MLRNLLYKFEINSIDVTSYVSENTKIEHNRIKLTGDLADVYLSKYIINVIIPEAGNRITISRGITSSTEDYIFKGIIKSVSWEEDYILLTCSDLLQTLDKLKIKKSYDINIDSQAGVISEIFKDIVDNYTDFTADVQDSGTDFVVTRFVCNNETILNRLTTLASLIGWYFYYDYNTDKIVFKPKGYDVYPNVLKTGTNVYNLLVWNEDIEKVINKITIEGAYQLDTRQDTFTGDGTTTEFNLNFTPETTEVSVNGTLKIRGTEGQLSTYDYSVDKELKKIKFVTAPASSSTIICKYQTYVPAPVQGIASDSIARYGVTHEEIYHFSDLKNVADAELRLNSLLALLKNADISTDIFTDEYYIRVGMAIDIEDINRPEMNGRYIVRSVKFNYPSQTDVITIGTSQFDVNEYILSIDDRLRILEGSKSSYDSILIRFYSMDRIALPERRYMKIEKKEFEGEDGFILGNSVYGILGTSTLGDVNSTTTIVSLIHSQNTYKEFLYDEDFFDYNNSTATWDTTNKKISFNAGEYIITNKISAGVAYNNFNVSLGSYSGSLKIEISGDNGDTWQDVVLNSTQSFNNSDGTGILLKITENNSSTAEITNTYYADGSYNLPAIKIILS